MDELGSIDGAPGLPLLSGNEYGCFFSKICVIVWTRQEAKEIQELLTGFYLAKANDYDTPFSRKVISESRIVVLDEVIEAVETHASLNAQTIEGIESASLLSPIIFHPASGNDAIETIRSALNAATQAGERAAAAFAATHDIGQGYCGYAHACTYNVTSPIIQLMLKLRVAGGPFDGKVVVHLQGAWQDSQSMDYHEAIYRAASDSLTEKLGVQFHMVGEAD